MADLTIRVVNNGKLEKEFNVHSFLFLIGSEIFERMLNSNFKEGFSRVIEIKDVDLDILQVLINYFYGQPLDLKNLKYAKQLRDLTDIADYYMVHGLKDEIAKYCESLDTPGAACLGLMVAEKCNAPNLKDMKLKYVASHTKEVVEQEEFLSLSEEDIGLILEQDSLEIKEFDLFKAVEAWIKQNVDKYGEQIIDALIPKVRYLSMTREEFTSGPAKSNLIKCEDRLAMLCNFNLKDSMPFPSGFSQMKRKCSLRYDRYDIELNFETENSPKDFTIFGIKANKSLTIDGFYIFTMEGNPIKCYDEEIVIRAGTGTPSLSKWPTVGGFKGKTNYSRSVFVQLDKKFQFSEGTIYWVWVQVKGGGIHKLIDLHKPLNVGNTKLPFTLIKHPSYLFRSYVKSIKLQNVEA